MKYISLKTPCIIGVLLVFLPAYAGQPEMPAGHPVVSGERMSRLYGKVVTAMDANNYTYVQIDTGEQLHWAAGPKTILKKGSMVAFDTRMPFTDFESKALNRKFKIIYFVNHFITDRPGQAASAAPALDPHAGLMPGKAETIKDIKKVENGKTVAEVFREKQALAGKAVRVRGKVMKYTPRVMGRNWLHIQDSSSNKRLVVSTEQDVRKGDLVLVNGIVTVDQDLGYGYTYEIIVERALVSVE